MPILKQLKLHKLLEGEPGAGGGGAPNPAPAAQQSFSHEYVRELREENKNWRLKHEDAMKKAQAAEEAAANAVKDVETRTKAAQTAADERVIRAELKAVAIKSGMVDVDGLKLADLSTVKLNEQGEVEGADALIEGLKKAKPYLFGAPNSSNTKNDPPPNNPPAAKKATEMTAEEYAAEKKKLGLR